MVGQIEVAKSLRLHNEHKHSQDKKQTNADFPDFPLLLECDRISKCPISLE